jgi:hypothetical protein
VHSIIIIIIIGHLSFFPYRRPVDLVGIYLVIFYYQVYDCAEDLDEGEDDEDDSINSAADVAVPLSSPPVTTGASGKSSGGSVSVVPGQIVTTTTTTTPPRGKGEAAAKRVPSPVSKRPILLVMSRK